MEGCRGIRIMGRPRGEGNQLILRVKCVIHFFVRFFVVVFFFAKIGKIGREYKNKNTTEL